jgi:RHS repeat-associated protein
MGLVNADGGMIAAQYEYGPFGELIRATGPMAKLNPFRFSTKYQHEETDLIYYGYRYYAASSARWLSRDPLVK